MHKTPLFSLIVPTLNEGEFVPPLLKAIKEQTCNDFEVIVVDAKSTDNTLDIIKRAEIKQELKIITTQAKNVSISRNLGAKKATGQYLVFIDADNSLPSNFLETAKRYVEQGYHVAIPKLTPSNNKAFDKLLYKADNVLIHSSLSTPRPFSTGSTMVVSRGYFEKVNGFDPDVYIAEDHDIIRRLKKVGAKIKFMNDTFVIFSTRRFDQQGLPIYLKYIYCSLLLIFFSKIKKRIYTYEMGGDNFQN